MMDDIWIGVVKLLNVYFSRLLTKEDFRKAVKERWAAERSMEFEEKMRMLIPAQFPKVWGETRIANKIGMSRELAGKAHRINTGGDERYMSLYLRRVSHSGLDWPSKLTLDQFLPLHAPLLDFLVEDAKWIDAWKYPKLEELGKYQRIRGLNLKMLDRIEVRELVCGVSSASEILKVRSGVKRKKSSKPGKQKRMRMRSAREAAAGSRAEEPVDLSPSQPSPGSSRSRIGFGESVSGPLEEGGSEEVVILEDDEDVFLEAEEERSVRVASPKRRRAALQFSRKVVEQTPTYDERIEGSARDSPREEMDLELDVPWEDRMF